MSLFCVHFCSTWPNSWSCQWPYGKILYFREGITYILSTPLTLSEMKYFQGPYNHGCQGSSPTSESDQKHIGDPSPLLHSGFHVKECSAHGLEGIECANCIQDRDVVILKRSASSCIPTIPSRCNFSIHLESQDLHYCIILDFFPVLAHFKVEVVIHMVMPKVIYYLRSFMLERTCKYWVTLERSRF